MLEKRLFVYQQDFESADRGEIVRRWDYFVSAAKEIARLVDNALFTGEFYHLSQENQFLAKKICQFSVENCKLTIAS